jgi:hypothetical protein
MSALLHRAKPNLANPRFSYLTDSLASPQRLETNELSCRGSDELHGAAQARCPRSRHWGASAKPSPVRGVSLSLQPRLECKAR